MVKVDQDRVVVGARSTGSVASKTLGRQLCTDVSHVAACAGTEEKNWVIVCWAGDILCTARKSAVLPWQAC
eukprot:13659588-Ditylum_brightwellii.AAC.1